MIFRIYYTNITGGCQPLEGKIGMFLSVAIMRRLEQGSGCASAHPEGLFIGVESELYGLRSIQQGIEHIAPVPMEGHNTLDDGKTQSGAFFCTGSVRPVETVIDPVQSLIRQVGGSIGDAEEKAVLALGGFDKNLTAFAGVFYRIAQVIGDDLLHTADIAVHVGSILQLQPEVQVFLLHQRVELAAHRMDQTVQ